HLLLQMELELLVQASCRLLTAEQRPCLHAPSFDPPHTRPPSGAFDYQVDGRREAFPALLLFFQLGAPRVGYKVTFGLAAGLAFAPSGAYPSLLLEAMQGRVQRALLHLQNVF